MGIPRSQSRMPRMEYSPLHFGLGATRPSDPRSPGGMASAFREFAGRMNRVRFGLLALLVLAACAEDPPANSRGGLGDPVRGAALYAPRNLGDTSRWQGRPAEAAVAVEQLEFLTSELATNPRYAPEVNPAVLQSLQVARTEM